MAAADKLVVLREHGAGLLARVSRAKHACSGESKPDFLGKGSEKLLAAINKKFPLHDGIERVQGFTALKSKAKQHFDLLEPYYFALVDAHAFCAIAGPVLVASAQATTELVLSNTPNLTEVYFDVLSMYGKLVALVDSFEERRAVLVLFYKLYQHAKQTDEPSFTKVSKWVASLMGMPMKPLADEFAIIGEHLGRSLSAHLLLYARARNVPGMRKEGTLNLTLKPEDVAKPVADEYHLNLHLVPKICEWVQWTVLVCPESIVPMGDLAKTVLQEVFQTRIVHDHAASIHHDLHHLVEVLKTKNIAKAKKLPKETLNHAVSSGKSHRERRVFLRQEMSQLIQLMQDQPALLGPKFPMVLAALSMAREELLHFFRHVDCDQPKLGPKKLSQEELGDKRISELLWLVVQMKDLVETHRKALQDYYLGYLGGADANALRTLADADFNGAVGPGVTAIVADLIETFSGLSAGQDCSKLDFRVQRLNWLRAESAICGGKMPLSKIKRAIDRVNLAIYHTRIVDQLDELLEENGGLGELYFYQKTFSRIFSQSIKESPNQPLHAVAFLRAVAEFPLAATRDTPEDRKEIGSSSQKLAERMVGEVVNRVVALLHEVGKKYLEYDAQTDAHHAAFPLLLEYRKDYRKQERKAPPKPGAESSFRARSSAQLDKLRLYARNAWQLCTALSEVTSLPIYHAMFTPREFLREKIGERLGKYLRGKVMYQVGDEKHAVSVMQRPSILLAQVQTYASVLKQIEAFVDVDIDRMMREVVLGEFFSAPVADVTTLAWCDAEETDFADVANSTAGKIRDWYRKLLGEKGFKKPGVVYSEARLSFVSPAAMPNEPADGGRIEYFADMEELRALCKLGGAYLCLILEREVLKYVLTELKVVRAQLAANKGVLEDFATTYKDERKADATLKKLKDPEVFLLAMIGIGNALAFRRLLFRALGEVTAETIPLVHSAASAMFSQYRQNTFMARELLPADCLAHACGIPVGGADQALKRFLTKIHTKADQPLWDLLPTMISLSFYAPTWKTADYRSVVEAHSNNVGVVAYAASDLLIGFKAIASASDDEKEIVNMLERFLEVTTTVLLRIGKGHVYAKTDKIPHPVSFESMVIFLDKFTDICPLLTRDTLERIVPYSLLVNDYHVVYKALPGDAKARAASAAASADGKTEDVF